MNLVVDSALQAPVTFGATGMTGLAQEVRIVLSTRKGSLLLDRDFGLDWSFLDATVLAARPLYIAEVARQIEKYVPRVKVISVTFKPQPSAALDGILLPVVTLAIRKEYINDFV